MRRKKDLSISSIYTTWVAVRNAKLAKLPKNNFNVSCRRPIINDLKAKERFKGKSMLGSNNKFKQNFNCSSKDAVNNQSKQGVFHVFVRGYNSYTLFYDIEDRVQFLLILDEEAKKRATKISAFILMDNHFHLQVITSQLSSLMSKVLSRYSRRFRKKYELIEPVFTRPFGRSQIYSSLLVKENMLYILSNASREHMCPTHRDYFWSSYNTHPEIIQLRAKGMLPLIGKAKNRDSYLNNRTPLPIPKRCRGSLPSSRMVANNDINQIIEVDTSFMIDSFKNLQDLDYSVHNYKPLRSQLTHNQKIDNKNHNAVCNSNSQNLRGNNNFYKTTPDSEIIDLFINLLDGRKLTSLNSNERSQIIAKLKRDKKATKRQIYSIMRIHCNI